MDRAGYLLKSLKNLFTSLKRSAKTKELVGSDELGNKYYRWEGLLDGRVTERRQVKVKGADYLYDPKNLPTEWRMWLQKTRTDPPTEEELARSRMAAAALRKRVAALEQAEELRRFRLQSLGQQGAAAGGPDLGRFVQQVGAQATATGGSATSSSTQHQAAAAAEAGDPRQSLQADAGAFASSSSEASGAGESFKPGTWKP